MFKGLSGVSLSSVGRAGRAPHVQALVLPAGGPGFHSSLVLSIKGIRSPQKYFGQFDQTERGTKVILLLGNPDLMGPGANRAGRDCQHLRPVTLSARLCQQPGVRSPSSRVHRPLSQAQLASANS